MKDGQEVGQEGNKKRRQERLSGKTSEQGIPANVKGWRCWLSRDYERLLLAVVKRSLMEERRVFLEATGTQHLQSPLRSQPAERQGQMGVGPSMEA